MDTNRTVESLYARIGQLVAERQRLREREATDRVLERNRRQITRCQRELSRALIQRHLPAVGRQAA